MSKYKKIVQWSLTFCCGVYIVWFFVTNRQKLQEIVFTLPLLNLVGLLGLTLLGYLIYSYRFQIILKKCSGCSVPFYQLLKIVVLGRFLSLFAPQAGNIYRSIRLKKNYRISYTRYASSFFSFTWMDTCLNLAIAFIVTLIVQPDLRISGLKVMHVLLLLMLIIMAVPILLEIFFRLTRLRNRTLAWMHGRLSEMLTVSVGSLRDCRYISKIILTGGISFIHALMTFYLFFITLQVQINLPALALYYIVLRLSNNIIITPGNIGVREIAYGILSEQIHIGMAQGILISLFMRVIGTLILITLGLFFGGSELLLHRERLTNTKE